jgi:hypothetical protein
MKKLIICFLVFLFSGIALCDSFFYEPDEYLNDCNCKPGSHPVCQGEYIKMRAGNLNDAKKEFEQICANQESLKKTKCSCYSGSDPSQTRNEATVTCYFKEAYFLRETDKDNYNVIYKCSERKH